MAKMQYPRELVTRPYEIGFDLKELLPFLDKERIKHTFVSVQQAEAVGNAGAGRDTKEDTKAYELYKNSLDVLVNSGIDLKPLKIEEIFNQVKLTDKKLWSIAYTTFQRDVWPIYSKENNLGKQPGRPNNK